MLGRAQKERRGYVCGLGTPRKGFSWSVLRKWRDHSPKRLPSAVPRTKKEASFFLRESARPRRIPTLSAAPEPQHLRAFARRSRPALRRMACVLATARPPQTCFASAGRSRCSEEKIARRGDVVSKKHHRVRGWRVVLSASPQAETSATGWSRTISSPTRGFPFPWSAGTRRGRSGTWTWQ